MNSTISVDTTNFKKCYLAVYKQNARSPAQIINIPQDPNSMLDELQKLTKAPQQDKSYVTCVYHYPYVMICNEEGMIQFSTDQCHIIFNHVYYGPVVIMSFKNNEGNFKGFTKHKAEVLLEELHT